MTTVTEIVTLSKTNISCEEYFDFFNRSCTNSSITNGSSVPVSSASPPSTTSANNSWDDATWILTSAFVIFTMQSGFGLLESGLVSRKNEVNIMVKNAVDVLFGGLSYWMFGYAFSFGTEPATNPFCGIGYFFTDSTDEDEMGWTFAKFVFQASFATTATTIVSGAMAERTKLESYCLFSLINTLIYCFPAHWVWAENGYFAQFGAVDIAGAGAVHLVGGITGFVATLKLKPRRGRFDKNFPPMEMSNPTNALLGMFMLWWGWLGFNCGSTFGISGGKWKLATRTACTTITASIGGGITGISSSWLTKKRQFDIGYLINGVLGGLVACTAMCALCRPWQGLVIGVVGGTIAVYTPLVLEKMKIDDPVGVVGVHCLSAYWGLISVGLFTQPDNIEGLVHMSGLFYGGGFKLLGIQVYMGVAITIWTFTLAYLMLYVIDKTIGLRCSEEHEILGADLCEHGICQLSLAEKLEVTRELIRCGYESPFMEELRRATDQPDFIKFPVRRDSCVITINGMRPSFAMKNSIQITSNGDLSNHEHHEHNHEHNGTTNLAHLIGDINNEHAVMDSSVSIDIEQNWNNTSKSPTSLSRSSLKHRNNMDKNASVTSNEMSPSVPPHPGNNHFDGGRENPVFDDDEKLKETSEEKAKIDKSTKN